MKNKQLPVSLPPELREWLKQEAYEKQTSEAAIVRRAVKEMKEKREQNEQDNH